MGLDYSRHPRFQRHKDNGFYVVAYDSSPGEYFDESGRPVSDEIAAEAGYNVAEDRVERDKRQRIAQARVDADMEANRRIAEIRAGNSALAAKDDFKVTAHRRQDGAYDAIDVKSNERLREGVNFEEIVEILAITNGFGMLNEPGSRRPVLEAELDKRDKPTGKFKVSFEHKVLGEALSREEAEALALKQLGV